MNKLAHNYRGFVDDQGEEVCMMTAPEIGYKTICQVNRWEGNAVEEARLWGFWAKGDSDGVWLFFDTPDDETYDINNYKVYFEPKEYNGE